VFLAGQQGEADPKGAPAICVVQVGADFNGVLLGGEEKLSTGRPGAPLHIPNFLNRIAMVVREGNLSHNVHPKRPDQHFKILGTGDPGSQVNPVSCHRPGGIIFDLENPVRLETGHRHREARIAPAKKPQAGGRGGPSPREEEGIGPFQTPRGLSQRTPREEMAVSKGVIGIEENEVEIPGKAKMLKTVVQN
jgi:hypothetical protein